MSELVADSMLSCPHCGHVRQERMPTDACLWFYECGQCRSLLTPKPGDCCVFCSYGTVPCPPVQQQGVQGGCCG
ncbi:GDCCVxC domain-containing (seleno)protein [Methylibium sp.]|uniref:GDCCVxC domain-containing (seleno)protein n=1 Tax=Methylibium sp. TaxID=2067992 RepID=UPI0025D49CB8|nr:GDCCVxC domain-containing (seleno)protein [Methylibium sp.]